jgi:hypothetical protein
VFICGVCRRVMRERPDLPVFTIHDCIYTVPGGAEYVRGVIVDEFGRLGVRPRLERA